ncbi:serine/threonine protein phosphatase 1 [Selenomonas ruminantium]|uniref:Serine/threonine protein phosphatase 1 n=1 Tax=Selenomonas ruminantium TaxID=971 RepID=A0A1M6TNC3_SELRU|nr:metallophosphoesterase [Selenomonas ruminantium]SHK58389.1 serine/threonine protein phosphatase 1 [Selenomonas ruminantium]
MEKIDRLLVIGDIHGKWERFKSVYDKVSFNAETDLIVFLGDYLDRGDAPVPVMEWVMEHYGQKNMVFLRGNHEQMFYDAFLESPSSEGHRVFSLDSSLSLWLGNGGQITYEGIRKTGKKEELIADWLSLVAKLPLCTEIVVNNQTYWFMHANCNPGLPLSEQDDVDLLWRRTLAERPNLHNGEQIIVLGHTPVQALGYEAKPQWLQNGRLVLMDTGSYLDSLSHLGPGKISCADLLSGEIYQSAV